MYHMSIYPYLLYINHTLFWELNYLTFCTYDKELTFLMVRLKDLEIMVGYGIHNEKM